MRQNCRFCNVERKEGVDWHDDDYCSGKCKKSDGGVIPPVAEQVKLSGNTASLEDYLLDYPRKLGEKDARGQRVKGRLPKLYRRRFEPEKLNWGEPLNAPDLKQAGFRANRKPILGDFDFVKESENVQESK